MADIAKKVTEFPFDGEVAQKNGATVNRRFNVRVIEVQRKKEEYRKAKESRIERQRQTQQGLKTSNVTPLEDTNTHNDIVDTPYNMLHLVMLKEESNILSECVSAMVTNIEGFGNVYRLRKIAEGDGERHKKEIEKESIKLDSWTTLISPEISFIETRKRTRDDIETTGNGFWEIVRLSSGTITEINHVISHRMRLTKKDDEFTEYITYYVDSEDGYKIKGINRRKRFRRYVQLDEYGMKGVYFKEYGDPRKINKNTGKVDDTVDLMDEATEMIHFRIYSARTPYGIPRYMGRYVSILGSRRSEEINLFTLSNNHMPSCFVIMENGTLTPASVERLGEVIETQIASDPNFSKMVILEGESAEDENFQGQSKSARIKIHEFDKARKTDEMFQDYDKNNQKKIRRSFRLPPLLIGESDDYTRATARESVRMGDEQVFNPEREMIDSVMSKIMLDQGYRWYLFKSRTPNVTDNMELAAIAKVAEGSGGMTPRRTNSMLEDVFEGGELGPLPKGIDLDVPYSLQFAQAQNAQRPPTTTQTVERSYSSWLNDYISEFEKQYTGSKQLGNFIKEFQEETLH